MSHSIVVEWATDGIAVLTFSDPVRANQLCWAAVERLAGASVESRPG